MHRANALYSGRDFDISPVLGENEIFGQRLAFVVPFDDLFIEKARVYLDDEEANEDRFEVEGGFTLGVGDGIDPLNEDSIVVFDGFSATLSAGSCILDDDEFECEADVSPNGSVRVEFDAAGEVREFRVRGRNITLTGIDLDSPVTFSMQIGDDFGEAMIDFNGDDKFEALNQWLPGLGSWLARLQHLITPWQNAWAIGQGPRTLACTFYDRKGQWYIRAGFNTEPDWVKISNR